MPDCHIIAGSNGAGKTTFARECATFEANPLLSGLAHSATADVYCFRLIAPHRTSRKASGGVILFRGVR